MDDDGLAAAVHLAVDLGVAEGTFDHQWDTHADVAVVGASFNVGLKLGGQNDIDAAVARSDTPAGIDLGAGPDSGINAAVAGPVELTRQRSAARSSRICSPRRARAQGPRAHRGSRAAG